MEKLADCTCAFHMIDSAAMAACRKRTSPPRLLPTLQNIFWCSALSMTLRFCTLHGHPTPVLRAFSGQVSPESKQHKGRDGKNLGSHTCVCCLPAVPYCFVQLLASTSPRGQGDASIFRGRVGFCQGFLRVLLEIRPGPAPSLLSVLTPSPT